ncbi:LolA family protein [Actinocrispum wychmicini]|uniref:MucB/RseB family protein n=1 Tax=Actinocrispum wychmicini TaxID=1213861 RepID=A0A4R2JN43_9PSEU|nr:sigma-E factor regulatory protein RseB domain-containing protein [Actinocrispum wychmicini]TCO58556.1 MucB/RseB family protein [Actinocrispum wychmicini]
MNTKKTVLTVAGAGVLAGVIGLGALAMPAGANEPPPSLSKISADELVQSVATAKIPALSGKVQASENLGLPIKLLQDGLGSASVYADGQGHYRATLPSKASEKTYIYDGTTFWSWDSAKNTVTKSTPNQTPDKLPNGEDPATFGKDLLSLVRQYSDVKVDGTARVASRPAYELVVTPKPTERTLLRELRLAVDSETRLPLRAEVLANGQSDPALKVEFSEFKVGAQDPNLFKFTPPQGATVKEHSDADKPSKADMNKGIGDLLTSLHAQTVGDGWDTTLVAKLPGDLSGMLGKAGDGRGKGFDMTALLKQFGKQVSGPYGTGYLFTTKVATALVTDDGRVAVGAVPEQVLVEALGQVK